MNDQPTTLQSDNLISRISRLHITDNEFKNESGEKIAYKRAVLHYSVNGKPKTLELAINKDKADLLDAADVVDGNILNS